MNTFHTDRATFAEILRVARANRTLRSYGRLGSFGRSLITDNFCALCADFTSKPSLNIHR